ncbi:hypothetical protein [Curtobacterium sp. 314Chir4.1]|uniref:hypothetical protein n=1 Tax=Curtobacterium sp. 314Chir4.1 TaxID=1279028 RepID=UPI000BE26FD4|nr:hypothetical protein [Curtobacterium sp. 314Chir4.1]
MVDDIETIIRRIVREELGRFFDRHPDGAETESAPEPASGDTARMLWDVAGVAELTGLSRQYIRNDIRDEKLDAGRLHGKKFVIDSREALRYAEWLAADRPESSSG